MRSLVACRLSLVAVLVLFMVGSACGLGVTPGRTTVNFEPDLKKTVEFEIVNAEGAELSLTLSADGELSKYITISSKYIALSSAESSKKISYSVNLPHELEPGLHRGEVIITEIPKKSSTAESYVQATLAVAVQFYVNVPYPGKFATANLVVYNANQGEDVTFVLPVVSKGEFDLTLVKANVDIYNRLNEKVDSFSTSAIEIPSGEKKELVYKWKADVPVGEYRAVATVIYDEGVVNLEGVFSVGKRELELQDITVNNFNLGDIVKLEMLVENKWSEPISGAYVETMIKNDAGDVVSNFKSSVYDVAALVKQVFVSYWDTAGVKEGNYQTEVSINYGDKSSRKTLQFEVSQNELVIVGLGYVISAGGGGGTSNLVVILIVVIVVLVLINLLWFFLLRKRLKR